MSEQTFFSNLDDAISELHEDDQAIIYARLNQQQSRIAELEAAMDRLLSRGLRGDVVQELPYGVKLEMRMLYLARHGEVWQPETDEQPARTLDNVIAYNVEAEARRHDNDDLSD